MKYVLGAVVLTLVCALLGWLAFGSNGSVSVDLTPKIQSNDDTSTSQSILVDPQHPKSPDEPHDATEEVRTSKARTPSTRPSSDPRMASVVGRCVGPDGAPISGCVVALRGWSANRNRMDEWLKDHDEVQWDDPVAVTTGADGGFEFRFVPPVPYQFALDITARRCIDLCGHWQRIEEGQHIDLGDVALTVGMGLIGRVSTTKGAPVAEARAILRWQDPLTNARTDRRRDITPVVSHEVTTATDGSFEISSALQIGTWNIHVRDHQIVEPQKFEVDTAGPIERLDIVVVAEEDIEKMTGIVVDDRGVPVEGARVYATPWLRSVRYINETTRDGAFTIRRGPSDQVGPFTVHAGAEGYEAGKTDDSCAWGARDLRVVLRRGASVDVCVRSPVGEPIEEYGVRVFLRPGSGVPSSGIGPSGVRNRGKHERGVTTLTGLVRGTHVLVIEPTGRAWQRSPWHEFEVTDSGAPRQNVVLQTTVERVVRVARADGERIEGTRVQLVESTSKAPIDIKTPVFEDAHSMYMPLGSIMGRQVDNEVTDERGEVTLEGPGGTELALRVLGPGHVPVCQNDIILDRGEGPIEVVVPGGARVVGTLGPVDLLERVWQQSGLPAGGAPSAAQAARAPGVRLMRKVGDLTEHIPVTGKQACEADGSFAIEGVPPGTWTLQLLTSTADRRMYSTSGVAVAQIAGLTDGETRKVDVDLTNHVQSTLRARVVLDGKAYADGLVTLAGIGNRDVSGQQAKTWSTVRTDSAGEFEQLLPPGQYHATLQIQDPSTNRWDQLAANESVVVNAGVPATVTFVVYSATLRLSVRGSNGETVTSVRIVAERAIDAQSIWLPEPDDEGVIHTRLPSGTWKLRVRCAEYMDVQKFRDFLMQHQGDANAWKLTMQDVREIQVASGGPADIRIDLPASAGF